MTAIIKVGQILTARSTCDCGRVYSAEILERKGAFVTVKVGYTTRLVRVLNRGNGEFIYAMGKFSMHPVFHNQNPKVCNNKTNTNRAT